MLAAYGGLNHVNFLPNGEISVRPLTLHPDRVREFNDHMMLFYTGIKRTASDIAKTYVEDIDSKKTQLRIMRDLVEEGLSILTSDRDIADFGELLHETWQLKRSLSDKTTNPEVDRIYEHARSTGALGGKLTGAGGGGFMLLFAPPERHARIKKELQKLIYVPFKIEFAGSQIIFLDHEEDYSAEEAAQAKEQHREFRELAEIEGGDS